MVADSTFELRRAAPKDLDAVLALFDDAVAWLVANGNTGQWGTEPFSQIPARVEKMQSWLAEDGAWVAERDGLGLCGAIILGEAHDFVPAATGEELYVRVLIGSRRPEGKGVGRFLLGFADDEANRLGVPLLRVDCYGGGQGDLVRFYESAGYERTETFKVKEWPGQILERRLAVS